MNAARFRVLVVLSLCLVAGGILLTGCDSVADPIVPPGVDPPGDPEPVGRIVSDRPLPDLQIRLGAPTTHLDLGTYFRHTNGAALTFQVDVPDPTLLSVSLQEGALDLSGRGRGETELVLRISTTDHDTTAFLHTIIWGAPNPCIVSPYTGEDDYFPIEDGATWTFDYEDGGGSGGLFEPVITWEESGTYSMTVASISCGTPAVYRMRTVRDGMRSTHHEFYGQLPDEPIYEEEVVSASEGGDRMLHLYLVDDPDPFSRYHAPTAPDTLTFVLDSYEQPDGPGGYQSRRTDIGLVRGVGMVRILQRSSSSSIGGGNRGHRFEAFRSVD